MGGGQSNKKKEEEKRQKEEEEKKKLSKIDMTILQCKQCRDNMNKYIKRMGEAAEKKKLKAKELVKKKQNERAKIYLKQCKLYKFEIENAEKQKSMVEEQIMKIESNSTLLECQNVLSNGNKILKELQNKNNVANWEKIKDDMDDLKAEQDEINDFLKSHNIDENEYNEDIEKEMAEMEKELNLPSANTGEIIVGDNEKKEEKKIVISS